MSSKSSRDRKGYYLEHEGLIWLLIIAMPLLVLGMAYLVAPETVWNDFIWRYYMAPVEADVQDATVDGVTSSYNPVDTATYGIVMALALFGIYRMLKRMGVRSGKGLLLGTIPYILLGGVLRSLEDAGMFTGKAVYLTIAPFIYMFVGVVTIMKLLESHRMEEFARKDGKEGRKKALMFFAGVHVIWNTIYGIGYYLYINERELFSANTQNVAYLIDPSISILLSVAAFLGMLIMIERRGRVHTHDAFAVFGWHFLALAFFHAMAFMMAGGQWPTVEVDTPAQLNLIEFVRVPFMALAATFMFVLVAFVSSFKARVMDIFWKSKVNVIIIFAHMFDAAATFTALQWYSYGEKHVVPNMLIRATGTPAVMFLLKALVLVLVLYMLDVELKDDLKRYKLLKTLVLVAIFVLGLAPGTRDLMRLAMGV